MSFEARINGAVEYIEMNLENKMNYADIAKIAGFSEYHFSRVFAAITDISLSEYIRNRRLTVAASELVNSDIRIIDLAVKYTYDSADSFSRAFQNYHGVRPSLARNSGAGLKTCPKLSFQIHMEGGNAMEYRIEGLNFEFDIVGIKKRIKTSEAFEEVPKLWFEAERNGLLKQLIDMAWETPQCKLESLLGVSGDTSVIENEEFEYMMGVRYMNASPENMERIRIPKSTWAVFPNNTIDIWKKIYSEWLPASEYKLADIPVIECFYPPGHSPEKEIWVPIQTKK